MRQFLLRISVILLVITSTVLKGNAQDTTRPTSVDPDLLNIETTRIPKEYTIAGVSITGIHHLDTSIVLSIAAYRLAIK